MFTFGDQVESINGQNKLFGGVLCGWEPGKRVPLP